MRTMKKVLSLTLVIAMALSMVAGAAYKDESTINADLSADVNLLLALNVFTEQGTGEGNFEPTGEVTRATAAKLVYVLKNKGVDDGAAAWANLDLFADVPAGHWAAGYVNYCTEAGIIAGTGDGFKPNDKIDATQMAKLLLVLLGYKPDLQGYAGNAWAVNVRRDAQEAGLYNDYGLPITGAVTREWSAKLMVNAINGQKVRYNKGEIEYMYDLANNAITYASQDLGLKYHTTGVLMGTAGMTLSATDGTNASLTPNGKVSKISDVPSGITFNADPTLLGQTVKVLYKDATGSGVGTLGSEDKIYGIVADGTTKVYNVKAGDLKKDAAGAKITVPGLEAVDYTGKTITVYANDGSTMVTELAEPFVNYVVKSNLNYRLIDNNADGVIDALLQLEAPIYAKVASHDAAKSTITFKDAAGTTVTLKDTSAVNLVFNNTEAGKKNYAALVMNDTVVKDDVVAINVNVASGKQVYTISKITPVTGKLEKVASDSVTVAGTAYKLDAASKMGGYVALPVATELGNEISMYTAGAYVIFSDAANKTTGNPTNLAMVTARENGSGAADSINKTPGRVQVITADGKTVVYDYVANGKQPAGFVPMDADGKTLPATIAVDNVYLYKVIDGKIALKVITAGDDVPNDAGVKTFETQTPSTQVYDKSKNLVTAGGTTYIVTADTIYFTKEAVAGKDVKYGVIKGKEIPGNVTGASAQYAVNKSGIPSIAYGVFTSTSAITAPGTTDFVYGAIGTSGVVGKTTDETAYIHEFKFLNNMEEEVTITAHDASLTSLNYKNQLYKAVTNDKGVTTLTNVTSGALGGWTLASAKGATDEQLLADPDGAATDTYYKITADTKKYYVDSAATDSVFTTGSGVKTAVASANNILFQLKEGSSTEIAYIFVNVAGTTIIDGEGLVTAATDNNNPAN